MARTCGRAANGGCLGDLVLVAHGDEREAEDGVLAEAAEVSAANAEDDGRLWLESHTFLSCPSQSVFIHFLASP